jgi:hypothetical protein
VVHVNLPFNLPFTLPFNLPFTLSFTLPFKRYVQTILKVRRRRMGDCTLTLAADRGWSS